MTRIGFAQGYSPKLNVREMAEWVKQADERGYELGFFLGNHRDHAGFRVRDDGLRPGHEEDQHRMHADCPAAVAGHPRPDRRDD